MADDARSRTKVFLDTYVVTPATIMEDNGTTPATVIVQYSNPPYPMIKVFLGKSVDAVFNIDIPQSEAIVDSDGQTIGYNEKVPILIQTVTKPGVTGDLLLWNCAEALRAAVEAHWIGSFRSLTVAASPKSQNMGGWILYGLGAVLTYERDVT